MYKSIEEATLAKMDIVERMQSIDLQLTEKGAEVAVGHVPDEKYREYLDWKTRAMRARTALLTKLQRTKHWIKQERDRQMQSRMVDTGGPDGLLADMYDLAKSSLSVPLDIEDQALLDDVQAYLQRES